MGKRRDPVLFSFLSSLIALNLGESTFGEESASPKGSPRLHQALPRQGEMILLVVDDISHSRNLPIPRGQQSGHCEVSLRLLDTTPSVTYKPVRT